MRKSLSDSGHGQLASDRRRASLAAGSAIALSAVLAVAAGIDQAGGQSLVEHARSIYTPQGEHVDPGLLYGLLYFVAAAGVALWWLVLRAVRSRKPWAPLLAGLSVAISATLALSLLASTEYGARIFPPLWGGLAILPCLPGIAATALLVRNGRARLIGTTRQFTRGVSHGTRTD